VVVDEVALRFDDGYRIDPDCIAARLSPATRLVTIATPQNPSGVRTSADVVRTVLDAMSARAPGAFLFVDETYRVARTGRGRSRRRSSRS
jgi:aspartate/methionine/tyrosine aminotransferase